MTSQCNRIIQSLILKVSKSTHSIMLSTIKHRTVTLVFLDLSAGQQGSEEQGNWYLSTVQGHLVQSKYIVS